MAYEPKHMKWWGWGNEDAQFNAQAHPNFWPYAKTVLAIGCDDFIPREWNLDTIQLPESCTDDRFLTRLRSFLNPSQISDDSKERVIHAYGKGFRDLFRMRRGMAEGAPDLVLYPESEDDVLVTLRAAARHDVVVSPFGGGPNIAGCLE